MQQQAEGGVIEFIASVSALLPSPRTAAYGAVKAGVLNLPGNHRPSPDAIVMKVRNGKWIIFERNCRF